MNAINTTRPIRLRSVPHHRLNGWLDGAVGKIVSTHYPDIHIQLGEQQPFVYVVELDAVPVTQVAARALGWGAGHVVVHPDCIEPVAPTIDLSDLPPVAGCTVAVEPPGVIKVQWRGTIPNAVMQELLALESKGFYVQPRNHHVVAVRSPQHAPRDIARRIVDYLEASGYRVELEETT